MLLRAGSAMGLLARRGDAARAPARSTADGALIEEIRRSGDRDAFGILVERYQGRVFRLVVSILGPGCEAEAEDVTQDVFLQVYRKLHRFRGDSGFATWLYRIAKNRGLDRKRRARFRLPHVSDEELDRRPAEGGEANPHARAAEGERRRAVQAMVSDLPEPGRTVVHLYYWSECSVSEIADYLGIKPGTVKSHLHRARRRLAARLENPETKENHR